MATDRVQYRSFISSNDRWDGFVLRPDDIIIMTPPKSGTTWMQQLVALLLFDGRPPRPVSDLSPWLDMNLWSTDEVFAVLAGQAHRRFIKTHTPLDGLPWHEDVTYLAVGRDPRDVFVSMLHHLDNMNGELVAEQRAAAVGDADLPDFTPVWPDSDDPRVLTEAFLELAPARNPGDMSLAHVATTLEQVWAARHEPNMHLFHYADLRADLPRELARLAQVLGVATTPGRIAELAEMATLDAMRATAEAAPGAGAGIWKDPARFFRAGRNGDGLAAMTDAERVRYDERAAELMPDAQLRAWVHGGRLATGIEVG